MCFDLDSAPPIPVLAGGAVAHEDLELEAADGTSFAAFAAHPDEPARVGVVVLPDVRGLYRFYEELALRFAERGYLAVAIDYFGRTAGVAKRDDDFEYMEHVARDDGGGDPGRRRRRGRVPTGERGAAGLHGRLLLRRAQLVARSRGRPRPRGCGGLLRVDRRTQRPARAGAEGGRDARSDPGSPGGRRREHPARGERGVRGGAHARPGCEHELVTYAGAPHSFFDRKQEEFAEASEDAWRRTLEFIERYA